MNINELLVAIEKIGFKGVIDENQITFYDMNTGASRVIVNSKETISWYELCLSNKLRLSTRDGRIVDINYKFQDERFVIEKFDYVNSTKDDLQSYSIDFYDKTVAEVTSSIVDTKRKKKEKFAITIFNDWLSFYLGKGSSSYSIIEDGTKTNYVRLTPTRLANKFVSMGPIVDFYLDCCKNSYPELTESIVSFRERTYTINRGKEIYKKIISFVRRRGKEDYKIYKYAFLKMGEGKRVIVPFNPNDMKITIKKYSKESQRWENDLIFNYEFENFRVEGSIEDDYFDVVENGYSREKYIDKNRNLLIRNKLDDCYNQLSNLSYDKVITRTEENENELVKLEKNKIEYYEAMKKLKETSPEAKFFPSVELVAGLYTNPLVEGGEDKEKINIFKEVLSSDIMDILSKGGLINNNVMILVLNKALKVSKVSFIVIPPVNIISLNPHELIYYNNKEEIVICSDYDPQKGFSLK